MAKAATPAKSFLIVMIDPSVCLVRVTDRRALRSCPRWELGNREIAAGPRCAYRSGR